MSGQHVADGRFVDVSSTAETNHPDDVDAGLVNPATGAAVLIEKYQFIRDLTSTLKDQIITQLNSLQALYASAILPDGWQDRLRGVTIGPVEEISRGSLPTRPTLSLPDDWPSQDDVPILGYLRPVPDVDLSYTEPTEPDEPDPNLDYTPDTFSSPIFTSLFNKIYDVLENGGTGLDADVEDDLWNRGRERQRRERALAYQQKLDATGADGFEFAGGAQAAILLSSDAEWAQQETNLNAEITIKQADLAYQATQFFTDKALAMEQILLQFFSDFENRSLEAKKTVATFILQKYQEKVRAWQVHWDGIKFGVETKLKAVEVIEKQNDVVVKKFDGEMGAYTALVDLMGKKISALVEGYKGEVTGYASAVDAEAKWWAALTEEQKTKLEADRLELQKEVEEVKALVEATVALNGLKEKISEAIANITAQVLASALTAVHTSLSYSSSKSESLGETWGHSDSLTETHSFEETAT